MQMSPLNRDALRIAAAPSALLVVSLLLLLWSWSWPYSDTWPPWTSLLGSFGLLVAATFLVRLWRSRRRQEFAPDGLASAAVFFSMLLAVLVVACWVWLLKTTP